MSEPSELALDVDCVRLCLDADAHDSVNQWPDEQGAIGECDARCCIKVKAREVDRSRNRAAIFYKGIAVLNCELRESNLVRRQECCRVLDRRQ